MKCVRGKLPAHKQRQQQQHLESDILVPGYTSGAVTTVHRHANALLSYIPTHPLATTPSVCYQYFLY